LISCRSTGTPVALYIVVYPGVQFKSVEGDGLFAEGNLGDVGPDLGIELVPVHTEISRGVTQTDQARIDETPVAGASIRWASVVLVFTCVAIHAEKDRMNADPAPSQLPRRAGKKSRFLVRNRLKG
jgi:hypothetical protein